jgi:hypothetical protein
LTSLAIRPVPLRVPCSVRSPLVVVPNAGIPFSNASHPDLRLATMPAPGDPAAALPLSLDLEDFKVDTARCRRPRGDGGLTARPCCGCRGTSRSTRCSGALWTSCSRSTAGTTTPCPRQHRRPCWGLRLPSSPLSTTCSASSSTRARSSSISAGRSVVSQPRLL